MVRLKRNQIAAFVGNDPDAIRAIEEVFAQSQSNDDAINTDLLIDIGNASSAAAEALSALSRIEAGLGHEPPVPTVGTLSAGAGLTGGGYMGQDRSVAVGAGTGITVNADDVALDTTSTRNTDHASVTLTAGAGLTGGGDITASRTFNVGAGTGITVNADDVALTIQTAYGTYTPTLTNVANLDASTAYACQYLRVGNTVTVSGKVDIDPTLAATVTQLGISLPIASNFTAQEQCGGTAAASGIAGQVAAIRADATNDRAELVYVSGDITNQSMYFSFTYVVA